MDGFQATRARAIIEALHRCVDTMSAHIGLCQGGAVDPRIRRLIGHDNENIAGAFGEACSNVFWVLGASCAFVV